MCSDTFFVGQYDPTQSPHIQDHDYPKILFSSEHNKHINQVPRIMVCVCVCVGAGCKEKQQQQHMPAWPRCCCLLYNLREQLWDVQVRAISASLCWPVHHPWRFPDYPSRLPSRPPHELWSCWSPADGNWTTNYTPRHAVVTRPACNTVRVQCCILLFICSSFKVIFVHLNCSSVMYWMKQKHIFLTSYVTCPQLFNEINSVFILDI